ncbi:hypothetical protein M758_2G247700, partial [Ceratodon purpureus]
APTPNTPTTPNTPNRRGEGRGGSDTATNQAPPTTVLILISHIALAHAHAHSHSAHGHGDGDGDGDGVGVQGLLPVQALSPVPSAHCVCVSLPLSLPPSNPSQAKAASPSLPPSFSLSSRVFVCSSSFLLLLHLLLSSSCLPLPTSPDPASPTAPLQP